MSKQQKEKKICKHKWSFYVIPSYIRAPLNSMEEYESRIIEPQEKARCSKCLIGRFLK